MFRFLRNVWAFRRELSQFRCDDYSFTLDMFQRSLINMENFVSTNNLCDDEQNKNLKLKQIRRAVEILENRKGVHYLEKAEAELGSLRSTKNFDSTSEDWQHDSRIFRRADRFEDMEWVELCEIIRGSDKYRSNPEQFDGTNIKTWWWS